MVVRIFIDRQELIGYTEMSLTRRKDQLTGELSFSVFMNWLPLEPVLNTVSKGREVLVYIGDFLAFTGFIDRRQDTADHKGGTGSTKNISIAANQYTVKITARGKTKALIDSSHQHPTGTMLKPTNRSVIEELIKPWGFQLDWQAQTIDMNRARFSDGGRVIDEIQRIAEQSSLYVYETSQGTIKVTDEAGTETGEAIILGQNILSFSSDQAEDTDRNQVKVKGQLTTVEDWGVPAVLPTLANIENTLAETFSPVTVQLFGNATPENINRRAQYELNRRTADSKKVTVDVFHVQQTTGAPWDIGLLHYVQIPPADVYDTLEVVELTYTVDAQGTLQTSLTLSPPPAPAVQTGKKFMGDVKQSASSPNGGKPSWSTPIITPVAGDAVDVTNAFLGDVTGQAKVPPTSLGVGPR